MNMPSRPRAQPFSDRLGLVGGVIVHDEVDVEIGRDIAFDLAQEAQELASAMAGIAAPDDLAGGGVESGEQAESSVARVGVRFIDSISTDGLGCGLDGQRFALPTTPTASAEELFN